MSDRDVTIDGIEMLFGGEWRPVCETPVTRHVARLLADPANVQHVTLTIDGYRIDYRRTA